MHLFLTIEIPTSFFINFYTNLYTNHLFMIIKIIFFIIKDKIKSTSVHD